MILMRSPLVVREAINEVGLKDCPSLARSGNPVQAAIANIRVSRSDRLTKIFVVEYQSASPEESLRMVKALISSYKGLLEKNYQQNNKEVITLIRKARDELKNELDEL